MKNILKPTILYILLFTVPVINSYAQLMQFCIGGPGNEIATKVKYLTTDQATVIAGYTYDLSGGVVSNCQALVMKVYHGGTIAWQKTFGVLAKNNVIQDMIITHDGNIVIVGIVGRGSDLYTDNTAAILKYNSSDGHLMWQTCIRATPATTGGEVFHGVTELSDGRLVAVGNRNMTPAGGGGMICVFHDDGTFIYDEVLDIASGDDLYSATTSASGDGVYICGVFNGSTFKDGRVLSYTPGTISGTVNWSKYFDFALFGTLSYNSFNNIYCSGSKLIISGGCLQGFTTTGGLGHFVMTLNATDGSGAQIKSIQNSGTGYANEPEIAVVDSDHIYAIQSPSTAYYDPIVWITGVSTNTVVNDITSLSAGASNPPVRFSSVEPGEHSFLDLDYRTGLLHLAGATNIPSGFGNNDIYYVASGTNLASLNHDCDTAHETVSILPCTYTNPGTTYTSSSFTPAYSTVDTGTAHLGIKQLCGDLDITDPTLGLYPNPLDNALTIRSKETINNVRIVNLLGQEVYNGSFNNSTVQINTESLPKGIYYVSVNNTSVRKVFK